MPFLQLISENQKLKKALKDKFKTRFSLFTAANLKDALKNIHKNPVDLVILDGLPVNTRLTSWNRMVSNLKSPMSGEIGIIIISDPNGADSGVCQALVKSTPNCQIFWYNTEIFSHSDLFLNALESTINFSMDYLRVSRSAQQTTLKLDSLKTIFDQNHPKPKSPSNIFTSPVSFLPETNSNIQFINEACTSIKTNNFVLLKGQEGLEAEKVARYISWQHHSESRCSLIDFAAISGHLQFTLLFGTSQSSLPGFKNPDNGLLESLRKDNLILKNIHHLRWEVQHELLLLLKNGFFIRDDSKISLKSKLFFITSVNLEKYVEKGIFRQDLYSMLTNNMVIIPTLQQRKKDLPLVFDLYQRWFQERFQKKINVSQDLKNQIINRPFPGQFEHFFSYLHQAFSLCSESLNPETLQLIENNNKTTKNGPAPLTSPEPVLKPVFEREDGIADPTGFLFSTDAQLVNIEYSLVDLEREYIKFILSKNYYNIAESSRILGITRKTLYDKLKKFRIKIQQRSSG